VAFDGFSPKTQIKCHKVVDLKRAVFLDRDGVVNRAPLIEGLPHSPRSVRELEIMPGVREAVSILLDFNYEIVVVTNQPDISRGLLQNDELDKIHKEISSQTGIKHFFFCIHDNQHRCACRKPKPGMLIYAALELNLSLERSFLVGDRRKDIQAGQEAGCQCFFIDYEYPEKLPDQPFYRVASLLEAAVLITENQNAK